MTADGAAVGITIGVLLLFVVTLRWRRRARLAGRRRVLRRFAVAALALVTGISTGGVLYLVSVQPGAALVRAVFEVGSEVTPPAGFESIASTVREQRRVPLHPSGAPDAHVDIYRPVQPASAALPIVVWIHGGGFLSSSADTVRDYAILLAAQGYVVLNLDYSLAPGAHHPVPVLQGAAALDYAAAHAAAIGGDPSRMFVGGDSAGAQIASELAAAETNPTLAAAIGISPSLAPGALRGVVLFCGLYDMRTVAGTGFPALRTFLWSYTGTRDWLDDPDIDQLSTTSTATAHYPATFLTVGDADPFRTQEAELARTLRGKGVPVTALTWSPDHGLGHEYQFDFALPEARTAFQDTLRFLAARSEAR